MWSTEVLSLRDELFVHAGDGGGFSVVHVHGDMVINIPGGEEPVVVSNDRLHHAALKNRERTGVVEGKRGGIGVVAGRVDPYSPKRGTGIIYRDIPLAGLDPNKQMINLVITMSQRVYGRYELRTCAIMDGLGLRL